MALAYDFSQDDTASSLRVLCRTRSGSAIDLTGATVQLQWIDAAGVLQARAMTIEAPATAGNVSYQFAVGELAPPSMHFTTKITDGDGKVLRSTDFICVTVREKLG